MTVITWTLNTENGSHVLRLVHGYWRGNREISVDNAIIERGQKLFDYGSGHLVTIDNQVYELAIVTNGITFSYFLLKDGCPIPSDREKSKGRTAEDLLRTRYLKDLPFWKELGQSLGLGYYPNINTIWRLRPRLVGSINGYLTLLQKGIIPNTTLEGWLVLVRHSSLLSLDVGKRIRSDNRITLLLKNLRKVPTAFVSNRYMTWIFLPLIKKETSADLAVRVQSFLTVVSEHAHPLVDGVCENLECSQRLVNDRHLVLVNGLPELLCQECIDLIPERGKKTKEAYKKAPAKLLRGLIAGLGIAVFGGIVWAAVAVFLNSIAAVIPMVILALIVRGMDKAGTKRSGLSVVVSTLLMFISVTLGNLMAAILVIIRQRFPLSVETFSQAWNISSRTLVLAYFFAFLGGGIMLWQILSQQIASLSREFKPKVEIIPGKF